MKGALQWKSQLDEVHVEISGEKHYLWRAVDQDGEALESYVTKARDKQAALRFCQSNVARRAEPC